MHTISTKMNYTKAKKIIGVVSGKGGVGKSTTTAVLATKLAKRGYKVGILDADIFGPSIPRIFGLHNQRANAEKDNEGIKFETVKSKSGVQICSFNFYVQDEDQAVMWRGPYLASTLSQLFAGANFGEVDYLLIDMPPGTGDTAITVMQTFKPDGLVVVSTPQEMVGMIVKKLLNMAKVLNTEVYGIVQNMAYIECEKCGNRQNIFSKKSATEHSKDFGETLLAELPIDSELGDSIEDGRFEEFVGEAFIYDNLADSVEIAVKK